MEPIFVFLLVGLAVAVRLAAGQLDRDRIQRYVQEEKGGQVVSINWAPFGRGWIGERNARIYEVIYYDRQGDQHMATCKTSVFSGVYWTEDRVAHRKARWEDRYAERGARGGPMIAYMDDPSPAGPGDDAMGELERLREENERLRRALAGGLDLVEREPERG